MVDVTVDVLDASTGSVVTTATTDGSGHHAISVTQGTYDIRFTPPSGSGLEQTTIPGESVDADTVLDVTLASTPPDVPTVVAPRRGQIISGTYDLAATTTGSVDRVEFFIDDHLIGQATAGLGWNYRWDSTTVTQGRHSIRAKAYVGSQSALSPAVFFNVWQYLPGQIIDWDQTVNFPEGDWLRMTKLTDGTWLAATAHPNGLRRTEIGIYQSINNARTWTKIGNVDDGDRLLANPNLLQLPNGVVLLATRNWKSNVSFRISVWRSSDNGAHWIGPVRVAANEAPNGNQYLNLSEPWLFMLGDGRVSIMYSDGKDAAIGFRQKITQKVSPDGGLTWPSSKIYPAARQDDNFRPGMPVVLRLKNGQYFLVFEAGGSDNFYLHYKRSSDGLTWGSDLGTRISTKQQCGPGAVSLSDGRIVVTSCTHAVSYSSDYGKTWATNDPAFTDGIWPALYEIKPGVIAYSSTGPVRLRFGFVKPP